MVKATANDSTVMSEGLSVWKYDVPMSDTFTLVLPAGALLLHVGIQYGRPQLWALVNPLQSDERRHFRLAGTGHRIAPTAQLAYVGSFLMSDDTLVFHLFEDRS